METAQAQLEAFAWDKAYESFKAVADAAPPKSEQWAQATFGAAVAISNSQPAASESAQTAARLYRQILAETPKSRFIPRSMMNLGRLKELRDFPGDNPDLDGAVELYQQVAAKWPNDPIAGEATLRAAAAMVQAYDVPDFVKVKQGVALLEQWLAGHPHDPLASIMWQYLGDTYFLPLGDTAKNKGETDQMKAYYVKSLACYGQTEKIGWTDAGNQGPILWRCAVISEIVGNTPLAIRYYTQIVTDTPNSGKAYESQLALKRLGAPVPAIQIRRKSVTRPTTQEAMR
jgi:tetratricopeptide (TPR) repeat protein